MSDEQKPGFLSRIASALTGPTAKHLAMAFAGGLAGGAVAAVAAPKVVEYLGPNTKTPQQPMIGNS